MLLQNNRRIALECVHAPSPPPFTALVCADAVVYVRRDIRHAGSQHKAHKSLPVIRVSGEKHISATDESSVQTVYKAS